MKGGTVIGNEHVEIDHFCSSCGRPEKSIGYKPAEGHTFICSRCVQVLISTCKGGTDYKEIKRPRR